MAFKKIEASNSQGEKFKFEKEGTVLTGHYLGSEVIEINGDPATKHSFKVGEKIISPLGSADLNRQLSNVPEGMMTRVTYLGKKSVRSEKLKKTFMMNSFSVEVDDQDILAAAKPPTSSRQEKSLG